MLKSTLINILYELYLLNRSMSCNSSYGFFNSVKSLTELDDNYFYDHYDQLSEDPYKVYRIGSHIQLVIDDYANTGYPNRLYNTKRQVLSLSKLDNTIYDVKDDFISKRIPINTIKRYIKLLKIKYKRIKFGRGDRDPFREKYGVGSVTLTINKDLMTKLLSNVNSKFRVIRLKKSEAWLLRNDHTEFLIILKL